MHRCSQRVRSRPAVTSIALSVAGALLVAGPGDAQPVEPALVSVTSSPAPAVPGQEVTVTLEISGSHGVESVAMRRPSGRPGVLTHPFLPDWTTSGALHSATYELADTTASGSWTIDEVLAWSGADLYRFVHPAVFPEAPPCSEGFEQPDFSAVYWCASDVVEHDGVIEVGGTNFPGPEPQLASISFVPAVVEIGDRFELRVAGSEIGDVPWHVINTDAMVPLWAEAGPPRREGEQFVIPFVVGDQAARGVYRVWRLGVLDPIDEAFIFLNADIHDTASPCPAFAMGFFGYACASSALAGASVEVLVGGFEDVAAWHLFFDDITWLAKSGVTKGCNPPSNTRFCPDDLVTRGQMAAFLVRALGLVDAGLGDLFADDDGSVFAGDIDRLATAGVTRGCNPPKNDRFCPDEFVTRGQMAAFLVRALGYTDDGAGDLFRDDDASVFEADIDRLGTAGVTRGCNPPTNDRFCPDDFVTRAQMAAFLARAFG